MNLSQLLDSPLFWELVAFLVVCVMALLFALWLVEWVLGRGE